MNNRLEFPALLLVSALLVLPSCSGTETASDAAHESDVHAALWGYDGETGPSKWGSMDPDWILCAEGLQQSPIDLADATEMALPATVIDLPNPEEVQVVNQTGVVAATDNGHTIQVNAPTGETFTVGGDVYSLVQFHFHAPSEHTVNGEHYPMEMHFVHESQDGRLAMLGFFVEEGKANEGLAPLWARLPHGNGAEATVPVSAELANHLLPGKGPIWYYSGSLTTPPCSEGVSWFVRKDPIQMSSAQIKEFTDVYNHNNRPVQDLNDRALHTDSNPDVTYQ